MERYALQARSVTQTFGAFTALKHVSFDLREGEVHCLAGENGSGKSTLIKVINGVHAPEPGAEISFHGERAVARVSPQEAKRHGVHVIWQDLALFPDLTVAENISFDGFVARPFGPRNTAANRQLAEEVIARIGIALDPEAILGDLSIAKRQIVAICRVLAADARIIFMDEPTASLTRKETDALLAIVRRLSSDGISVVFVSHRLAEVLDVCARATVLKDGALVGTFPTAGMTQKRLSELMTGLELNEQQRPKSAFADRVLELKGLSRTGDYQDVSLTLHKGEILGLTGLVGSGRTELALTLFGMTQPTGGQILLDGRKVRFSSNQDAIDAGIAYVSEDRLNLGLVQNQSIEKNTAATVLDELAEPKYWLSPRRVRALCDFWIEKLRTKASDPALPVSSLSGGNQQRIVLAKWLATNPRVLILDAPTVGVDVGAKAGIFRIVRDLAEQGMAILLITDEAGEAHTHADRVLILRGGAIREDLSPHDISEDALERLINA
ncbi:MAG: sugar ABC transporter ATP-binding protein [Pseudomonadota bacterium]